MRLTEITLLAKDVSRLRHFYQTLFQIDIDDSNIHIVIPLEGVNLIIWAASEMENMVPGSMAHAGTGNTTLNVQVENVDAHYERLKTLDITWLKQPTTFPWGRRAMWFRDPEDNIVIFYQNLT